MLIILKRKQNWKRKKNSWPFLEIVSLLDAFQSLSILRRMFCLAPCEFYLTELSHMTVRRQVAVVKFTVR